MKFFFLKKNLPFYGLFLFALLSFACSPKKIYTHKDWGEFFRENNVDGCIIWNNYGDATFDIYGFGIVEKRALPAETFNIVNGMAGLETGVIRDTTMIIHDSAATEKLKGVTMAEAFRNNNPAYFQWVATHIGKKRMAFWVDSTYYGNKEIGSDLSDFWMDNTLKISPDEQVGLLQRLYRGQLAYQPRTQKLMKGLLLKKITHVDTLYYQQGVGKLPDKKIGWLVGWLKRKAEPYFFAIKTEAPDSISNLEERNMDILYKVFRVKGFATESGRLK